MESEGVGASEGCLVGMDGVGVEPKRSRAPFTSEVVDVVAGARGKDDEGATSPCRGPFGRFSMVSSMGNEGESISVIFSPGDMDREGFLECFPCG